MTPCDKIQAQLSAYLDQEIAAEQVREVTAHLAMCPPCAAAASAEKAIKTLVHDRARTYNAPPQLHARIRHELAYAHERSGFWQLVRELFELHPQPAFATLAVIVLAVSVLTYLGSNATAGLSDPIAYVANAHLEGNIICADCQLMMVTQTPCVHDAASHRLVLKCADGKLWNIVQSPQGRELLQAGEAARLVQTEGYLFPHVGYVQVTNFKVMQN
ncbi:zf-HC2 domain-containing protein [candidate division KSB1 bacterium]|nr:zf-HC2 domain-containing protein [candidate division KSB1 bacterium]